MTATDIAGWLGAFAVLGAYGCTAAGRWHQTRLIDAANALGSLRLAAAAISHHNWPSAGLNVLWVLSTVAVRVKRRSDIRPGEAPLRYVATSGGKPMSKAAVGRRSARAHPRGHYDGRVTAVRGLLDLDPQNRPR